MTWLLLFMYIFVFALFIYLYGNWKKHGQIPGPFPFPLIGSSHLFFSHTHASKTIYKWMELVNYYKGTMSFWLGPVHYVFISEPEHIQAFCSSHILLDHSEMYNYFKSALGDGLFTTNGSQWKSNRKAWAPSFHPSIIRHFVQTMKRQTDILVGVIEKETGGPTFPVFKYIRNCMQDIIWETALDYDMKGQTVYNPLFDLIEPCNEILYSRIVKIYAQNEKLFYLTPNGRQFVNAMSQAKTFINEIIDLKIEEYSKEEKLSDDDWRKSIFIRQLLSNRNLSREQTMDEIMTIIVTGYETVTRAVGFCLLMIGAHPDIQEKVHGEDKEVQRRLGGRELQIDDLNQYVYLEQVIKETLRIFPVGPIIGRVATEDMKLGNLDISKGTNVMCLMLATHRNPKLFPNPLEFNPDNFLPENVDGRHPYSFVPFSSGPRGCIGNKFGMMSLKIILSSLVRNYKVYNSKGVRDIKLLVEVTMKDADDFIIRLEKR